MKLRKVDESGNSLAGAKFKVYSDEDCTTIATDKNGDPIAELTSSADSDVLIGTLTPGTYYLKETAPPSGYPDVSDDVVTITVDRTGTVTASSTNTSTS